MRSWVVAYDCGEAQIVDRETCEEAMQVYDDLGCAPTAVYSPDEVYLKREPCMNNGQLRCEFVLRKDVDG